MCRAVVLIIKPIFFLSRRCGRRRGCLSSLLARHNITVCKVHNPQNAACGRPLGNKSGKLLPIII